VWGLAFRGGGLAADFAEVRKKGINWGFFSYFFVFFVFFPFFKDRSNRTERTGSVTGDVADPAEMRGCLPPA
jgi:hypothetical protein